MTDVVILRNGKPVESRPFTSSYGLPHGVVELSGWRCLARCSGVSFVPQLHVVLLEPPEPGDDLTYRDLAPEYDKVYVRWSRDGMTYVMRIEK